MSDPVRCALIGCGPMGAATARELVLSWPHHGAPLQLTLVDRDARRLHALAAALPASAGVAVEAHHGDAAHHRTRQLLAEQTVLATALSWVDAAPVLDLTLEHGLRLVGIGRPPADPRTELASRASVSGASIVVGAGLEPGLTEILARRLARDLDVGGTVHSYCGGVPRSPRPPMHHVSWYGTRMTIDARPTYRLRGGVLRQVERFSGVEMVDVPGLGSLEAFHDGLAPYVGADAVLGSLADYTAKTLRWRGYADRVRLLAEIGLLGELPVQTVDGPVRPRALLDAVLAPHISAQHGDTDVTVLAVQSSGTSGGTPSNRSTVTIAETDPVTGVTGMGRLTGAVHAAAIRAACGLGAGVHYAHEVLADGKADALLERFLATGISVTEHSDAWLTRSQPGHGVTEDRDE
jgi:saccharopine dehydrogenase-like NADP-dependent oxidoreductase